MSSLVLVVGLVLVVALMLAVLRARGQGKEAALAFERREGLFSPAERSFLGVLEQALEGRCRVFGKVRLGDLVQPVKGLSPSLRTTALNRINQKHVDFVLCSVADLSVLAVVELDDSSHGRKSRGDRDAFVDQVLAQAGLPVLRFSAKAAYSLQEVRAKLAEGLNLTPAAPPQAEAEQASAPEQTAAPPCPKCSAPMVRRQAKSGPHAGRMFWACTTYPRCRQLLPLGQEPAAAG